MDRQQTEHDRLFLNRTVRQAGDHEVRRGCHRPPDRKPACIDADAFRQHGANDAAGGVRARHIAEEGDAAHGAGEISVAPGGAVADIGKMRQGERDVAGGGENIFCRSGGGAGRRNQLLMQVGHVAARIGDTLHDAEKCRRQKDETDPDEESQPERPAATRKHFS